MRYLSLFDGIGAVHVAWQPLGWTCVATAEIDAFPAAVVALRDRVKELVANIATRASIIAQQAEQIKELAKERDQWQDIYVTALDAARGYAGVRSDDTVIEALQSLVDMRLRAEADLRTLNDMLNENVSILAGVKARAERAEAEVARLNQENVELRGTDEFGLKLHTTFQRAIKAEAEVAKLRAVVEAAKLLYESFIDIDIRFDQDKDEWNRGETARVAFETALAELEKDRK